MGLERSPEFLKAGTTEENFQQLGKIKDITHDAKPCLQAILMWALPRSSAYGLLDCDVIDTDVFLFILRLDVRGFAQDGAGMKPIFTASKRGLGESKLFLLLLLFLFLFL